MRWRPGRSSPPAEQGPVGTMPPISPVPGGSTPSASTPYAAAPDPTPWAVAGAPGQAHHRAAPSADGPPAGVLRPPAQPRPGHAHPDQPAPEQSAGGATSTGPRRGRLHRRLAGVPRSALTWLALAVVATLAVLALWRTTDIPAAYGDRQAREAAKPLVDEAIQEQARRPPEAAAAYERIAPSMVVIRTDGGGERGLGAGFVANADGRILTAYHVVDGNDSVTVTFPDGTETSASVVDDPERRRQDLAVLQPDRLPEVVTPATLGGGGGGIGDSVFAVGHPLGLSFSLSAGVVSGTGRDVRTENGTLEDLIQFDAAVNPGNSGGPLLNRAGQVIGVVTALANPSEQPFFVGIGFAVPISAAGGGVGAPPL